MVFYDIVLPILKCLLTVILGTVDYVNEANGYCTFRTSPIEKKRLVFQMGTANADRAVALGKMIQHGNVFTTQINICYMKGKYNLVI